MKSRTALGFFAAFLVTITIAGCDASAPEFGSVAVEIREAQPGSVSNLYDITINGSDGYVTEHLGKPVGSSFIIDDVPLGHTSIAAASLCVVESELSQQHPTMKLIIEAKHCTLAD